MKRRTPWVALVVLAVVASAARAQVKEPAELLPASTLASVELRQPARVARELAALLKGSAFEDMPGAVARFRAKQANAGEMWYLSDLTAFSLFLSPEMLAEGGRFRGGILGLTGIDEEKGPRYVGVLLTGDSNVPAIFYRGQMTFGNVRQAGQCEGVSIYQERRVSYNYSPAAPGGPAPPPTRTEHDSGPAMALLPGALVFGSPDAIKDVIRRWKGKSGDPSLANVSSYTAARKRDDRPGLFAYADFAALAAAVEESIPAPERSEAEWWAVLRRVLNPRAVPRGTAALTLHNGGVELQARLYAEGKEKSPLLGLFPDSKAPVELLHFVPRDALVAGAAGLGDGEKRWRDAVALCDALVKAAFPPGRQPPFVPSAAVGEVERKLKLDLGKDVFGRVSGAAVWVASPDGKRPGGPVFVLQGTDAKTARALEEEALPRLLGLTGAGAPARADVDGQSLHSVAGAVLPGWKGLHYGRSGAVLVIGPDGKRVAEALAAGRKKGGLLGEETVAAGLKELDGASVTGVASLGGLLVELYKDSERCASPRMMGGPTPPPGAGAPPGGIPATRVEPGKLSDRAEKRAKELASALGPLPPLVFGLTRQPDAITLTVRQPQLRRVSARAIDLWVEAAMERAARRGYGSAVYGTTTAVPMKAATPAPAVKDKPKK
jgi:hypothetical protein